MRQRNAKLKKRKMRQRNAKLKKEKNEGRGMQN